MEMAAIIVEIDDLEQKGEMKEENRKRSILLGFRNFWFPHVFDALMYIILCTSLCWEYELHTQSSIN